jgi:hypothetical protein
MVCMPAMAGLPAASNLAAGANMPASAASDKPLGMVVLATNAHVDSADAALGANVYGGDVLDTQAGGTLRLKVGGGQVYLLAESAATLVPEIDKVHAKLVHGTMGFAGASSDGIEIETPVGVVRAAEGQQRAFGQVVLRSATEMIVTSYTGALVVEREGERHEIAEGKTYDVTVAAEPAAQKYGVIPGRKDNDKLIVKVMIVGGAALAGFFLWCAESVSDYQPPCN